MAQEPETPVSPEAEARKTIDELKAQVASATQAARDALVHSRLVQAFTAQGRTNPHDLATRAQSSFADLAPDAPDEEVTTKASAWFDQEFSVFAGEAAPQEPTAPTQPETPLSTQSPNLTAPGLTPETPKVVVGSKEYFEQGWAGRSTAEQLEAMRAGDLVTPEKVRTQQQDNPMGLRS